MRIDKIGYLGLLLLGISFLFSTSVLEAKEYKFPSHKEFTLDEPFSLEVEDPRGEIILESHDQKKILISATKIVEAKDTKEAEEIAGKIRMEIEKTRSLVRVKTKYPKTERGSFWERLFSVNRSVEGYVSYHILVPKNIQEANLSVTSGEIRVFYLYGKLNLTATSGDIEITGAEGEISSSVTSGNIQVKDTKGKISLDGTSSDIKVKNMEGNLGINCTSGSVVVEELKGSLGSSQTSGDLEVRSLKGDLIAVTTSGDIQIEQTQGSLDLNTTSGDIEAKVQIIPTKNYSLETTSGEIDLYISREAQADLKIETTSGEISMKVPMVLKTASRNSLSGILGSGGGEIEINTVSGDIYLEEY